MGCNIDPETGEEDDKFSTLYIVYPRNGKTSAGTDPLISLFESYGTQSVTVLTTATSTFIGIMFWSLHLTAGQVKEVENHELVGSCIQKCTLLVQSKNSTIIPLSEYAQLFAGSLMVFSG